MDDASILDRLAPAADHRLSYGDGPLRFGDLRIPHGNGPFPVVVTVHGGFWRNTQDLAYFGHLNAALAARGVASWNIEYNRVGDDAGGWPGTFADVAAATDHLRILSPVYDLDPSRVIVVGHSAGGHLALWLSMRDRVAPSAPVFTPSPLALKAVISIAGVSDLRRGWTQHLGAGAVEGLLGGSPEAEPERYNQASPAALLPSTIPQLLMHGRSDEAVPAGMSEAYVAAARAAGSQAQLIIFEAGHFEPVDPATGPGAHTVTEIVRLSGLGLTL